MLRPESLPFADLTSVPFQREFAGGIASALNGYE